MEKELQLNDIYVEEALEATHRFLVLYGGGGSGKSVFAANKICIRTLTEKPHKFLCLRKVATTIKESVFAEIKSALFDMDCLSEFEINKTDKSFTHLPTGNQILCMGLDEPEKIKSIKGITGMWVEEATEFDDTDLDQLNLRIRGLHENYVQIIFSFNPISEDHSIKKRFFDKPNEDTKIVHTTHLDNHFLAPEDRKQLEDLKERNPTFYDIYCLGKWGVVDKTNKFLYSFKDEQVVKGLQINPSLPVWFTFDFNIDPMTVTVAQRIHLELLHCYRSIQLNESDIYAMCDRIKADYARFEWIVTGDASGHNRTGVVRGKSSYWKVIKTELGLKDYQMKVRGQNIGLIESRVLCNSVNQNVKILFDADNCQQLINECKYGQVDESGVLIKDRKKQKNDFLDGFRYLVDANFYDFLAKPNKYRRAA